MNMGRKSWLVMLAATTLCVSACGGGGGGGGDNPATSPADAAYSGVRAQAYIDTTNAEALVLGAYDGGDVGTIVPLSAAIPDADVPNVSDPYKLSLLFDHAVSLVNKDLQVRPQALLDPAQECLNFPAGTLSDTLVESAGDTTDTVSGYIYYSNCDVGGAILNGTVYLAATLDLITDAMTLSMTMNPLSYDDGVTAYSLTGSYSGSMTTNAAGLLVSQLILNVTLEDSGGKTYWLNNYVIDETEEIDGVRSTVRGRFYENDYGYVDFLTDPVDTIFVPYNPTDATYDGRIDYTGGSGSSAILWLGVNQGDYCINVFNASGVADIGTCSR